MQMYINGEKRNASDGQVIPVYSAATQERLDTVPSATAADVAKAVRAARAYQREWAAVPQYLRSAILIKAAALIEEHAEELSTSLCRNMGKVITEARSETATAAHVLRGYAERANHLMGDTLPAYACGSERDMIFTRREPVGVVAAIGPFNFPLELAAHKIGAALSVGNVVIYKPATDNPLAVIRMVELCYEAGVPRQALQLVTGRGSAIGRLLAQSEGVDAVNMTGSTAAGVDVAERSARTLKGVHLELGGNDPFLVFADADLDLAVREAVETRTTNCGQICCASKRFFVHRSVREEFVSRLTAALNALVRGDPMDPRTQLGCLINPTAADRVEEQIRHTIAQGAELALGGHKVGATFFEPTILIGVKPEMDIAQNMEVFGPVFPIIEFTTYRQAIDWANHTSYGLQGCIFTRDMKTAFQGASELQCGGVVINGASSYRHPSQPFGGYKMSGLGREGISHTLEQFTQEKSYILKRVLETECERE